jgi:IS5 family transposase
MALDLEAPDHTTLSRRGQHLNIRLDRVASTKRIHLMVDSSGLSIVGEGEWAAVKHGGNGKRAWKKLHLGVDRSGVIVAEFLTDGNADDSNTALDLLGTIEDDIASFTADSAYDTIAIYDAATARGAKVVVPPRISATRSTRSGARDRTVRRVRKVGRRQWKKESGYHRQARVENTFFRYKSIIGDRLRARHPKSQKAEAVIACNILNQMLEIGRPESFAICP